MARLSRFSSLLLIAIPFLLFACTRGGTTAALAPTGELPPLPDDPTVSQVADHLMAAQNLRVVTDELVDKVPGLDREAAYDVQLEILERREDAGDRVAGWKLGGTRVTAPTTAPDPLFGYSLESQVYDASEPLPTQDFVDEAPEVEAEIVFYIGDDLPGPVVSREELLEAISGVGGAVEILSKRLPPMDADRADVNYTNHAVADNLSHGGVILGEKRVPVEDVNFDAEQAAMVINGVEVAAGSAREIMASHGTPLDAVLWLANVLPDHGLHLQEGDYVVTGSLYTNPSVQPGNTAELTFSTLGTIAFEVE